MLVVDKYYQIVEKDSYFVWLGWKAAHMLTLFSATICALILEINFTALLSAFGNHCILNARLKFKNNSIHYNYVGNYTSNMSFHNPETIWGKQRTCDYCNFVYTLSAIIGIILLAFFGIVPKGGIAEMHEIYFRAWRIVIPSLIIGVITTLSLLAGYLTINYGISHFCMQFESETNSTVCTEAINNYTLMFNEHIVDAYYYIRLVELSAYMALLCWALLLLTLLARMLRGADFKIIIYNLDTNLRRKSKSSDSSSDSLSHIITERDKDKEEKLDLLRQRIEGGTQTDITMANV